MNDDERRDIEKKQQAAAELYVRICRAKGMSQEEMEADLRRCRVRMENLVDEGFTIEQAEKIYQKED